MFFFFRSSNYNIILLGGIYYYEYLLNNLSKDIIRAAINESFEALNEVAKIINGTSKETGYPLTNIKLAGTNVAVYVKGSNIPSLEYIL